MEPGPAAPEEDRITCCLPCGQPDCCSEDVVGDVSVAAGPFYHAVCVVEPETGGVLPEEAFGNLFDG